MRLLLLIPANLIWITSSCVTSKALETKALAPHEMSIDPQVKPSIKPKRDFHKVVEALIPITHEFGVGELKAEVYRPHKKAEPKTVVIMVPGSGNISRRGEITGDGVDSYPTPVEMNALWAKALADRGLFVLTYDKRTCNSKISSLCNTNDQRDVDQTGIVALSRDLDQVYEFAASNLDAAHNEVRLVLMSTTQGAQTIALSKSLTKVSGVVLLSPVVGDLESMWVSGLMKASEKAKSEWDKNQLLNRKESMAGFFASIKKGSFPETANVKGATAKFWMSWIEASAATLTRFKQANRPFLLLYNEKDVFSHQAHHLKQEAHKSPKIKVELMSEGDRNFLVGQQVPEMVVQEVASFIEALPVALNP